MRGLRLTLPCEAGEQGEVALFEDEDTQLEVASALRRIAATPPQRSARGTVVVPEGEQVTGEEVEALRVAIRKD